MPRTVRRTRSAARSRYAVPASPESFEQYLSDVRSLPMLSGLEEERELARRARGGDELAAERLATSNLRFVISFVKRYQGRGIELPDLVAIGNQGLLRAIDKFDPDRGVKFISYAVWWVRQGVLKALAEQTRSVRFPLNQHATAGRISRARTLLTRELGRDASDEELATATGYGIEEIRRARMLSGSEVSLDAPIRHGDNGLSTLGERLDIGDHEEIESATDSSLRRSFLDSICGRYLTPRERRVLVLYYGLGDETDPLTLEQIGIRLGVTRERVRQLKERAFVKLRDCPEIQRLGVFPAG